MVTVQPQQDGLLTVQLQVGQVCDSGTWISYASNLKTIAHGDTPASSLANLCEQAKEVCELFRKSGRVPSFQAANIEDSLQPFPHRRSILVTVPRWVG